ncbi:hypothetical protein Bca4012_051578 [Brassica carinata]
MTQSLLLGNVGEVKNGESTRKRLKISVPHFDNLALIKTFSKTLIGRCMNPEEQEMKALIPNLSKIWKLEEKVVGTNLGFGKFQFDFEKEEDMEGVLKLHPFHFDYWMLSLARWQPKKSLLYPSKITFWTVALDLDHSRVQVVVDAFKELCFETTVDFTGEEFYEGEEAPVSLRYEKLFGYCQVCGSLCHKDEVCPLDAKNNKKSPKTKREGRDGNGTWGEGDASRHRSARREDTRLGAQNEQTREQQGQRGVREKAREEGEIRSAEERVTTLPSQKFQEELTKTQADGTDAISDPTDAEQGYKNGIDMDAEDFLENLSEEEAVEVIKGQEEGSNGQEEEEMVYVEEEKGPVGGDAVKNELELRQEHGKGTTSLSKREVKQAGSALWSVLWFRSTGLISICGNSGAGYSCYGIEGHGADI